MIFFILIFLSSAVIQVEAVTYYGSKKSTVYHYGSCHYVDNILPENLRSFSSAQEAVDLGYRPCKVCKPPLPVSTPDPTPTPKATQPPIILPEGDFVTNVIDGDTFDISEGHTIRLADVDAPEFFEVGYEESKNYLESLVENEYVLLDVDDVYTYDYYGTGDRFVCLVLVSYNTTHYLNVNKAMVDSSYAVIDDFTNEFDPFSWTLYVLKDPTFTPGPTSTPSPTPSPSPTLTPETPPTSSPSPTPAAPSPTLNPTPEADASALFVNPHALGYVIVVIAVIGLLTFILKIKKR